MCNIKEQYMCKIKEQYLCKIKEQYMCKIKEQYMCEIIVSKSSIISHLYARQRVSLLVQPFGKRLGAYPFWCNLLEKGWARIPFGATFWKKVGCLERNHRRRANIFTA